MRTGKGNRIGERILAVICVALLAAVQLVFVVPAVQDDPFAASGGTLEVRVKYFGDMENKIRTKKVFSAGELRSMNIQECCYSNVTKVGTVMVMRARGPEVLEVINRAGIDLASVQRINFRAGDNYGYTRDFTVDHHLTYGNRYYYPNLNSNYQRGDDQRTLTPLEGSLDPAVPVPAILALEYSATKAPGKFAEDLPLETKEIYRFCMGQTPLREMTATSGENDVTSAESIRMIHGIDVTLYGSPVDGIMMDLTDGQLEVGSKKKVSVTYSGEELFAEDLAAFAGKLTWSSSDPSVVEVDQNGNITVLKNGTATITVTSSNGMSASVTIEGVGEPTTEAAKKTKKKKKKHKEKATAEEATNATTARATSAATSAATTAKASSSAAAQPAKAKKTVIVREISMGEMITPEQALQDRMREAMSENAEALGKVREYGKGAAAGTGGAALLLFGSGAALRIRRFRRDMM